MITFYAPSQVEKVVQIGEGHQYNILELHGRFQESSINSKIRQLELDQVNAFLNHHYQTSNFKTIFINMIYGYSFKTFDEERQSLVIEWIENASGMKWAYTKNAKEFFRISTDRSKPFEINNWINELNEYSEGKGFSEILKFLEYGNVMLEEEHKLHLVICKNKFDCNYCNQLTLKMERLNVFYFRVKEYIDSRKDPKEKIDVKNKIQWKGTQKELAELFIELKNNNWIEDFDYETIKACFSNSNTIQQVLKPSTDPKTGTNDYEQVYTALYKPQFHGILKNKRPA